MTAILAPGTTRLKTSTGFDTLVSPGSKIYKDSRTYTAEFGGDPVVVLLTGKTENIFSEENLAILNRFEETFSPEADTRTHSVLSPITILKLASEEAKRQGASLEWNDPILIQAVIGDSLETRRPEVVSLVPNDDHALFIVTPRGDIDFDTSLQLLRDVEGYFSQTGNVLRKVTFSVTGDADMISSVSDAIGNNMKTLLILSMGVMAIILVLSFRVRWNLLALFMVGIGALWTFGIMGYAGVPLSMSTMAVLPVLIGLGIDYSIQFHNRYNEEVSRNKSVSDAIRTSIIQMFPTVLIALVSTIIGFVTLYISEVPMVRDFGLMLSMGMILSFLVAIFFLNSIIHVTERRLSVAKLGRTATAATRPLERVLERMATIAIRFPLVILLIAAVTGISGAVVDRWLPAKSDLESLMPQGSQILREIHALRDVQGYMGELRFIVQADDVTDPEVLQWMATFQADIVEEYGVPEGQDRSTVDLSDRNVALVIGANSPATLISEYSEDGNIPTDHAEIERILTDTPQVFVSQFVSEDRRTASLSFSVDHRSMTQVNDFIEKVEKRARNSDQEGISISPAGSMALGASTIDAMMGNRFLMNILCLGAVFAVMFLIYRKLTRTFFAIIPVGMVMGWAFLDLYLAGIALNPLTSVLGLLVVGIGTEYMVLILGRYEEEKRTNGRTPHDAMVITLSKTGQALLASMVTTLGGFGVLIISSFVLLRDFGIATTIGTFLCLIAAMIVMPPIIVWWDTRVARHLPKGLR